MEFLYCIDANVREPIMLIDRHIGDFGDGDKGIMGDQFQREMMMLDNMGKPRIQVWINSVGGVVTDAMAIYNSILKCNTPVDTYNLGIAASAAGLIFQAGRKRYMNDYALLMIHAPFSENGEAAEEQLNAFANSVLTMLTAKCNSTEDEVKAMMAKETWLSSAECLQKGFCDEVELSEQIHIDLSNYSGIQNKWQAASKVLNAAIENNKSTTMIKVIDFLELNPAAKEDAVLDAVKKIATEKEAAILNATQLQSELDTLKAEKATMESRIAEIEASEAAAKDHALTVEAETMVNSFKNRIGDKAETVARWVNMAKADMAGTKAMIEAIPLNVVSEKIVNSTNVTTSGVNIAHEMAVRAKKK